MAGEGGGVITLTKADRTQIKTIRDLVSELDPEIAAAFLESNEDLQNAIDLAQLAHDLEIYGQSYASQLISVQAIAGHYQPLVNAIVAGTITAGNRLAPVISRQIKPKTPQAIGGIEVRFNSLNPKTQEYLSDYSAKLIRQITDETINVVSQVIGQGVSDGMNPRAIARDIKDNIGLTSKQEQAVRNYKRMLESRDKEVLTRLLRDKRFDATVRRAIENDVALSKEQIEKMTTRYRERYIKYRSEVIGRTEAMRAANSGSDLLWRQQIDDGLVRQEQVRREWVYTRDGHTRDAHRAIPRMNEKGVRIDEPFKTPLGDLMYPQDPNGKASNTIQCRCTVFTRVISEELLGYY